MNTAYGIKAELDGTTRYAMDINSRQGASHWTCYIDEAKTWKTQAGAERWLAEHNFFGYGATGIVVVLEIDRRSRRPRAVAA